MDPHSRAKEMDPRHRRPPPLCGPWKLGTWKFGHQEQPTRDNQMDSWAGPSSQPTGENQFILL